MKDDYLWKMRCPESGYIVGECGCTYCYDEYELDTTDYDYGWFDEELDSDDDEFWMLEDFNLNDEEVDDDDLFWEVDI